MRTSCCSPFSLNAWLKPKIEQPAAQQLETAEIVLRNPTFIGMRFPELVAKLPTGVAIVAVRRKDRNFLPSDNRVLAAMGVISGATGNPALLAFASRIAPTDRPDVSYAMIFPSMTFSKSFLCRLPLYLWGG